jgi:hypothetical protein
MASETVACAGRRATSDCVRTFGLFDATVLLAGVGLSLAAGVHLFVLLPDMLSRLFVDFAEHRTEMIDDWPVFWRATHDNLRNSLWYTFQIAETFLVGMTPAFIILRLRRPRPSLRVVLRYSGTVAVLSMVFGLFWVSGICAFLLSERYTAATSPAVAVGGTVAVVWCLMTLNRRWMSEPSWIDHVGRLLGAAAIGTALVGLILSEI